MRLLLAEEEEGEEGKGWWEEGEGVVEYGRWQQCFLVDVGVVVAMVYRRHMLLLLRYVWGFGGRRRSVLAAAPAASGARGGLTRSIIAWCCVYCGWVEKGACMYVSARIAWDEGTRRRTKRRRAMRASLKDKQALNRNSALLLGHGTTLRGK